MGMGLMRRLILEDAMLRKLKARFALVICLALLFLPLLAYAWSHSCTLTPGEWATDTITSHGTSTTDTYSGSITPHNITQGYYYSSWVGSINNPLHFHYINQIPAFGLSWSDREPHDLFGRTYHADCTGGGAGASGDFYASYPN